MDIGLIEVVVKKKDSNAMKVLQIVCVGLCIIFVLLGMAATFLALIPAVAAGVGAFFASRQNNLEYEYSYVEKELRVAKIHSKSSRKDLGKYDLDRAEIVAPMNSYRLENFKNKQVKTLDYSSGEEKKPDSRYVMYLDNCRVIFEPDAELIAAMRQNAPQKVFRD